MIELSRIIGALALLAGLLVGCNRVPGQRVEVPAAKPVVAQVAEEGFTDPQGGELVHVEEEQDLALEPLCQRACEHWVSLRFADPIGLDRARPADQEYIGGILERQRSHNLASCEAACVESGLRDRARCILRAMTADECSLCASSF